MAFQVKSLAELVGISVRTLHHYDAIGLLKPHRLSEAGYREYDQANLERLQQILFYKEIGLSLKEIQMILEHPTFDRARALQQHREILQQKKQRLETMIETVDKTLASLTTQTPLQGQALFGGFSMKKIKEHQQQYAAEAKARWGHTDAYKESQKRTDSYTEADWERIQAKQQGIYQQLLEHMADGPEAPAVQAAVADYRQSISDHFYDCTPEIFRGLGQMYVQDARFKAFYEKMQVGMADFFSQAIEIYCDRLKNKA